MEYPAAMAEAVPELPKARESQKYPRTEDPHMQTNYVLF